MSLADVALRKLLSGQVEIGLALGGVELEGNGYLRQPVPATAWSLRDGVAEATVTFGPTTGELRYDSGLLFVDGEPTVIGEKDPVRREPGLFIDYRAEVRASDG